MEIQIKTPSLRPLCTLKVGDCFERYSDYYIVTDEKIVDTNEIKCVNLRTGYTADFQFDADVFQLDALVTLRRIGEGV